MALKTDFRAQKRVRKQLTAAAQRYPKAIAQGMVSARRSSRTIVRRAIQEERNLKVRRINQDLTDKSEGPLAFSITGSREPISLASYGARRRKTGLRVQILKSSAPKIIRGGFLVKGRKDLPPFIRQGAKRKMKKGRYAGTGIKRQPLKALHGPSIADAMSKSLTRRYVAAQIKNAINDQTDRAITRAVGKRFA